MSTPADKQIQAYANQAALYMRVLEAAAPVEEPQPTPWTGASCEEFEALLKAAGEDLELYSGFTDMEGECGSPRIERKWARRGDSDTPVLWSIRHVETEEFTLEPGAARCEHYVAG